MGWHTQWDPSFDLSKGGIELSYRKCAEMSQLLVETEAIRLVDRVINKIGTPYISTRYHIIGARGFGKSTLLNYIAFSLFSNLETHKVFPVYVSLLGSASNEKELEYIFFRSLLECLVDTPSDFWKFYHNEKFVEPIERLNKAKEIYKKKLKELGRVSLEFIYTAFENQLKHLEENFDKIAFLIDGLDKQETDVVLKFFRNTQERMNTLVNKYNCIFLDAADPSWRETLNTKEFSGVRGVAINLRVWTANEVEALIRKRLEAIGIYQMPFERNALEILVEDFQGNPREILQYSTTLLHYAAKERIKTIGKGLAREIVWAEGAKANFFNYIISDVDARYAFEKLKTIYSDRQMMNILVATYGTRGQRLSQDLNYEARSSVGITLTDEKFRIFTNILITRGCLKISKIPNFVELEDDIIKLLDFVDNLGQSLVALPVVLRELKFKIGDVAPPPKEEVLIKNEIQKVFEHHSDEWLSYEATKLFLLENPKTKKKLEEHFKKDYNKSLTATIPLIIYRLLEDGKLMLDEVSSSFRWRPYRIEFKIADLFKSKELLDLIDTAYKQIEFVSNDNICELGKCCSDIFFSSFSKINKLFGDRIDITHSDNITKFLEQLDVEVSRPIPLKLFFSSLEATSGDIDEAKLLLQTAILYAKRIVTTVRFLSRYEPENQKIFEKLKKCQTGTSKEEERKHFKTYFLPVLMNKFGSLTKCMKQIKIENGILDEVPPKLTSLVENGQILQAELYNCPICGKLTIVSAKEVIMMSCPEDKVPLKRVKSGYILSARAYQAWNVWMEEFSRAILEQLPCKSVESGIVLKPIEAVGLATPEEVDLIAVFNGKLIAVECMESVQISRHKNDVIDVIRKAENLGFFDSIILVYRETNDQRAFTSIVNKHKRFLFPIIIKGPKHFKLDLQNALKLIKNS